MGRGDRSIEDR